MNAERPTAYDKLSPEAAARVDAACDGFEKAWKAARSGAEAPRPMNYLDGYEGLERTILAEELVMLDRACRERYGPAGRPDVPREAGAKDEAPTKPGTESMGFPPNAAAARPADWPSIPGLELVEVLGSGGMGVVFKARQATLDRVVAVKILRDAHRADVGQRERFLQEARAVARLRHPHLVQVYEFGEAPTAGGAASQPYLVLEYVSGGSLADLLRGSPQPPREAARLVETLADAIHYAHQQGVIHRDLKPANVLLQRAESKGLGPADTAHSPQSSPRRTLTADLFAKVTDFGLAKLLAGSHLTQSGHVLGTPSYMAPEQAAGKSGPTAAVDVYGLGAILYEALTGRPPFLGATADATLALVREADPVPPRRLEPSVPRDLETICLKCLRKEPGRRYASAKDLADDLRCFQAGEPIQARPVGTGERVVVWCRRNPRVAGLLTALVLVFVAGCAGVLWQWQRANLNAAEAKENADAYRRERDTARQETERAQRHLRIVHDRVDQLDRLGRAWLGQPGRFHAGQDVLDVCLGFYEDMLPGDGNDPLVRRTAGKLYGQVAQIHATLGQTEEAAEAYGNQVGLLATLLDENRGDIYLRFELGESLRWRGNLLRDLGKAREARMAYDEAVSLQDGLLSESRDEARYKVALANTLLNITTLLSRRDQVKELEALFDRILTLDRDAVDASPEGADYNAELALALGDQFGFFLDTGRRSEAEAAIREAVKIDQWLLDAGKLKGYIEPYAARNFARLGRVLAAAGQADEAEKSYQKAVSLLDPLVRALPESAPRRTSLADALAGQADLYKDLGRLADAAELRRHVIRHYEVLKADFPKAPQYPRKLVQNYLLLVSLLWDLGRQADAAEPYRKAFDLDPEDPDINNMLAWFLATSAEPRLRDAALAVQLAQKAVAGNQHSGDYKNTLGVALYRNGDNKAAIQELQASMTQRGGGDSYDWFFLAMAHWRLGDRDDARMWFDRAVQWMDSHEPNGEFRRFRAEAADLLAEASKH
jgi:tetratricopeptide (TPR) repeat protein